MLITCFVHANRVFRKEWTKLCDAFLSRRDKKEEQEDSVLAQRYRSYMPRMASVYGDWVGHGKSGLKVFFTENGLGPNEIKRFFTEI
tara:strand:+ start:542 stop:802 length:261 start_codon:yes stop_codon:yes gene_type:complete